MIWAGNQTDPGLPLYNTAWRFDFRQAMDPDRFEAAFAELVSACDAFRIVLHHDGDGQPTLRDTGAAAGRHECIACASLAEAEHWIDVALRVPFDLSRESYHSALIRISEGHWIWYLNQHHILTDASSGSLVFQAVARAYRDGRMEDLPALIDHARSEPGRIDPDNVAFWKRSALSATPLPRLYGRSVAGTEAAARTTTRPLGPERMERLNGLLGTKGFASLSRQQAIFNVFTTVLAVWVHRVSGETSVPLGLVTHGRGSLAARQTAGCFVELFPMHLELPCDATFRSTHAHVVEQSFEVLRHATPGSSTPRALTRFDTVINVMPSRFEDWQGTPVRAEWLHNDLIDSNHAFRLNVMELNADDGIALRMAFNASVFDDALQQAAERHFLCLLDACLGDPDTLIDAVSLSHDGDAASAPLASSLPVAAPPVQDVVAAFENSVRQAPDLTAVIAGGRQVSRAELADRVDAIGEALKDRGIVPADRVGIHLTRSTDLVAGVLAVLKIGATFVPLDPGQPPARLGQIAKIAGLTGVLSEGDVTPFHIGDTLVLDVGAVPRTPSARLTAGLQDSAAYVIFTSGSTGEPKGVVIGRASLARYALWASQTFADGESAKWALHSAIGFDLTITSIFAPLVSGGTIVAYREDPDSPNLSVLDVFRDNSVDVVKLTPAHLRLALDLPLQPGRLRALVLGGESLPTELANRACEGLGSQLAIHNEYGPTEATVGCMNHLFDPERDTGPTVPIGRPAADTAIYVLDTGLNPVADHVPGDLYIAGPDRLASGYLGRPDDTAAAFVANPFQPGLMYRSGDIASVRPDGTIRYHGRADDQVKIDGVRIEPAEIEAAARSIDGVEQCAVLLFDREAAGATLCKVCGVPWSLPGVRFVEPDLCQTCAEFEMHRARVTDYFGDLDELRGILDARSAQRTGHYDCVMLLSGGKDSTYALSRLSELTPNVLAATLDNGFISEEAKKNIRIITERLGIDHRFVSTPAMNEIFVDSLKRHANVCNGCFKTIYTLALHLAKEVGAPTVVTGLSRGQLFETRLAPELFDAGAGGRRAVDDMVLAARRSYHAVPDVATRRLNGTLFEEDDILAQIAFVDFYRYCDVSVRDVYRHLEETVGWSRPMDTGRSTNCLINDVGIHVHKTRRGHHNYALPYSWDVRLGHKQRDEAVEELRDEIDTERVQQILDQIGFDEPVDEGDAGGRVLVLYVLSRDRVSPQAIRRELLGALPRELVPAHIVQVDEIPLTPNGKVDRRALPSPDLAEDDLDSETAQDEVGLSDTARKLLDIWRRVLGRASLQSRSNFYDIGGDSLGAIRIAAQAGKAGIPLTPQDIFRHQSVAAIVDEIGAKASTTSAPQPQDGLPRRPELSGRNKARLEALFGKKNR